MLRPSFVPPAEIRLLRDYTRLRVDLTRERTRHWQRLEKLLEDALIKVSVGGLRAGHHVGAGHDRGADRRRTRPAGAGRAGPGPDEGQARRAVEALTGRFDDHHAELARMLLDQIDALTPRSTAHRPDRGPDRRAARAAAATGGGDAPTPPHPTRAGPDAGPPPARGATGLTGARRVRWIPPLGRCARLPPRRLDEIPGIGAADAQVIIAEIGLDMTVSPPPATWCPGPSCARAPSSPGPAPAPGAPARATPTSKASSAKPPPQPPRPTPSSATATGASSNAAASSKPSSPSPAPSWSSSGTCSPTPPPATTTSAPTTTPAASTPNAAPATTSANSTPSATPSPSNPPPLPSSPWNRGLGSRRCRRPSPPSPPHVEMVGQAFTGNLTEVPDGRRNLRRPVTLAVDRDNDRAVEQALPHHTPMSAFEQSAMVAK